VNAGKPNLLEALSREGLAPEIIAEVAAPLVDGDSVAAIGHIWIPACIGQLQGIPNPAYGADRVPHTYQVEGARPAEGGLEAVCDVEGVSHTCGFAGSPGVHLYDVGDEAVVAGAEEAEHLEHACDRSRGVGSPAEAEEVDVVALLVDVHQVAVGIGDVGQKAGTKGQASDDGDGRGELVGGVWRTLGAYAWMVVADLSLSVDEKSLVELDDVGVVVAVGVAGSVTADDDVLRHERSPRFVGGTNHMHVGRRKEEVVAILCGGSL
jgi:hypothetical protein